MKNFKSLIFFYLGLFSLSIIFNSCCLDPDTVTIIGGGDITFLEEQETPFNGEASTKLTGLPFSMSIPLELQFVENDFQQGFMAPVYGTSCENDRANFLDENSFRLSCDKEFIYEGETIAAGTDFGDIDELFVRIGLEDVFVFADQAFMDLVEFTNGDHEFTINVTTTDDLEIVSSGTIDIDID